MKDIAVIVLFSALISLLGTMLGASIGIIIKKPSNKFLSAMLGFAGGIMLAIVLFDLIPEAVKNYSFWSVLCFGFIGVIIIFIVKCIMNYKRVCINEYERVSAMTAVGLMIHNFPEGIIMGCAFMNGSAIGFELCIIIAVHDMIEGIAVAVPLMALSIKKIRIMAYVFITAIPTAIGVVAGVFIGSVSEKILSACLAIASGIMLYVVFGELIPQSVKVSRGYTSSTGFLAGMLTGVAVVNLL